MQICKQIEYAHFKQNNVTDKMPNLFFFYIFKCVKCLQIVLLPNIVLADRHYKCRYNKKTSNLHIHNKIEFTDCICLNLRHLKDFSCFIYEWVGGEIQYLT